MNVYSFVQAGPQGKAADENFGEVEPQVNTEGQVSFAILNE